MGKKFAKGKYTYIQFPLCALQLVIRDRDEGLNEIVNYGIFHLSKKFINGTMEEAGRILLYDYYRHRDRISNPLKEWLTEQFETGNLIEDETYYGFIGSENEFNPGEELGALLLEFDQNADYAKLAFVHWQINKAIYGLYGKAKYDHSIADGFPGITKLLASESGFGGQPMPSIGLEIIRKFKSTSSPIEWLLMYVSIKSLIGNKKFIGTTKKGIITRMIGAKNNDSRSKALKDRSLRDIYQKYEHRYHFDKLIEKLWQLEFIQANIGFRRKLWVSCIHNFEQLTEEVHLFLKSRDYDKKKKSATEQLRHLTQIDNLL